ncbi:MAG: hypothetical protein NC212_08105 [Staphylococcus sp.]|nr:hypothetical protein [Staphylococcus sp.]
MKYIVHIVVLCLLFVGCGRNTGIDRQLAEVERLIEVAPDSAMAIIDAIDANGLSGREQKAHYAILKSMALDKNYIDTTTFDVLQPAIDYYLENGSPEEKLRTYYYQGVIYRNCGDRDNALNSYAKAIDAGKECPNSLVLARAYVAQGSIYNELYAFEGEAKSYLMASQIYKKQGYNDLELDCLLNAYNSAIVLSDKDLSDSLNVVCNNIVTSDSILIEFRLAHNITHAIKFGDKKQLEEMVEQETETSGLGVRPLMNLAFAYHKLGDNDRALHLLNTIAAQSGGYDELKFLSIQEPVLEDLGRYKDALYTYKKFATILDSITSRKFEYMFNSAEERNEIELQTLKDKEKNTRIIWGCVGGIVVLVLGVVILLLLVRSNKAKKELAIQKVKIKEAENAQLKSEGERLALEKGQLVLENKNLQLERDNKALEAENLAHRVEILENESENLKSLMESQEELPSEVQDAIKVRIEMLNSLLAGYITANEQYEKPYDVWVRELTANTEEFMNSNRLAFQASHPRFIQYFEEHGLTVDEINYVCLYAIGLRGKEVGNYMKKRSHVNISSAIRKKLGIDKHETNIGIYVRKLLRGL